MPAGFNAAVTNRPNLLVGPEDEDDVVAQCDGQLRVRSRSRCNALGTAPAPVVGGLLIDISRLVGMSVDPAGRTARIRSGTPWQQVIEASAPHTASPR